MRSTIIFVLMLLMLLLLFVSRAALSVSMMLFVAICFSHRQQREQWRVFITSPLLWAISILFMLPLLSGLWSEDKHQWLDSLRIKLPLLFFPLAFASPFKLHPKQWEALALFFIALILSGTGWSLYHYFSQASEVNESYLRAKSILTPLSNDHVRFSWLISIAALLSVWLAIVKRKETSFVSLSLVISSVVLIISLHIMAVRTGLLSFYMGLLIAAVYFFAKRERRKYAWAALALIILLPFIAYQTLPTLQNRVRYILYDKSFFEKAVYLPGSTDGVRIISLKAGWSVMQEQPLTGVGFGDIKSATGKWYDRYYPQVITADRIYPSSEWLVYGAGAGWPGLLLFTLAMVVPLFIRSRYKLIWCIFYSTAAVSFLFDIGLEVQYGVFCFAFIACWWWKWFNEEKM